MKKYVIICLIVIVSAESPNAQKYGMFKIYGIFTLFADSLKAKNTVDWQIDQLKNDRNPTRAKQLDDYRLAVCYIAKNKIDSTCFYLSRSITSNPNFNRMILSDSDFDKLHGLPCWEKITNKIDSVFLSTIPKVIQPKLAVELFHIFERDQHAQGYGLKYPDRSIMLTDSLNLIQIEEIIKEYGWPTYSMVGKVAADGVFLVIQHSNINIQKKYLDQLLDAAKRKEASSESVALLQDRITAKEFHYQIYGTQVFKMKDPATGKMSKYTYYPIKDEENVDARRKEMGLTTLKGYLKTFGIDYVPGTKFQPPSF